MLSPTRELASRSRRRSRTPRKPVRLALCGGAAMTPDQRLKQGAHVVVGTPGRMLDHLQRDAALRRVRDLVLDEADRMLDMGFAPDVGRILF